MSSLTLQFMANQRSDTIGLCSAPKTNSSGHTRGYFITETPPSRFRRSAAAVALRPVESSIVCAERR